jgi:hypothetical protein
MGPMKLLPHVHTYVLNADGEPISKCIDSDRHPSLLAKMLDALRGRLAGRNLFLLRGRAAGAPFPVEGTAR